MGRKNNTWIEMGVFSSHIGFENAKVQLSLPLAFSNPIWEEKIIHGLKWVFFLPILDLKMLKVVITGL
jgi:hypothetical protein